jgi:hypothetical protein
VNHISWLLAEFAIKRRNASEFTARRFAAFAESKWHPEEGKTSSDLWDEFVAEAWNINRAALNSAEGYHSGIEED